MVPLFLSGVFFVVLAPVFWVMTELPPGQHIPRGPENADLYQRVYPAFHHAFGRLRAGELPLWNPAQWCGTPFLADPSTGVFQPLNAVFLVLPTERALAVHAFLCLFLMGAFFVLFARALDARFGPALLGGVVYAFSGAAAGAMSSPALAGTLAWAPLLFWGLREHIRARHLAPAVAAGLAGGFMVLAGAPLLSAALLLLATVYFFFSLVRPGETWSGLWPRVRGALVVPVVALGTSAVQWVPTTVWVLGSDRPVQALAGVGPVAAGPARLVDLPAMLAAPVDAPVPLLAHFGVLCLALAPAACLARRGWLDALFFLATGTGCLLLAAAPAEGPGLAAARTLLVYPAGFSLAVLATLGSARVLATGKEAGGFRHWLGAAVFVATAAVLLFVAGDTGRGVLVVLLVLALPVVLTRSRLLGAAAGLALPLLAFAELNNAAVNHYQHPFEDAPGCYLRQAEALAVADEQALGGRVAVVTPPQHPSLIAAAGMVSPVSCIGGYGMPPTREVRRWWEALSGGAPAGQVSADAAQPGLLHYMAARVLVCADGGGLGASGFSRTGYPLRPLRSGNGVSLYANDRALPRAYWVPGWRVARGVDETIALLCDPAFNGALECVVAPEGAPFEQLAALVPDAATASAQPVDWEAVECAVVEEAPERVVLRVAAAQPGVTVLADSFAPGWRARLDGRAVPLLRVNGLFRGIATPAGAHEIVMTYRPLAFVAGAAISLATLALLALAGCYTVLRG